MIKFKLVSFLFLAGSFWFPMGLTHTDDSTVKEQFDQCNPEDYPFKSGEELTYKMYYSLPPLKLSAGEVTFRIEEVGDEYKLSAKGSTYKSYEWFFKVRDSYETYVNKDNLLPTFAVRNIHEGNYKLYEESRFDLSENTVDVQRGSSKDDLGDAERFAVSNCVSDVLSLLYVLRSTNVNKLDVGDKVPMELFIDKEQFSLKLKYEGKKGRKYIPGMGRFNTRVFNPEVVAGTTFSEDTNMKVWVSDDGNKIPLLIKSPVSVGSVKAVLVKYKNLKHDLSSKVK